LIVDQDLSRALAPAEIRAGDYVAVLHIVGEHLPLCWGEEPWKPAAPVRMLWLPTGNDPLRVQEVCLPFLLVRDADGKSKTLDVRRYRLARLSERFGRKAFKRLARKRAAAALSFDPV
jgi:hypothetical protein